MPFDPRTVEPAPAPAGLPKIESIAPLSGPGRAPIDRSAFYSAIEVGFGFRHQERAFVSHCMAWGRKNGRTFASRLRDGVIVVRRTA